MKATKRKLPSARIDVGAFSDIAFLLIIFFILTTSFVKPFGHGLEIPSGSSDESRKDQKQLTVNLRPGQILYGEKGEKVTFERLRELLLAERFAEKKAEERMVLIECSRDLPYEEYFPVVMAISESGGVLALLDEEGGGPQ
jgi:biopolymer transport protein ExbD